MFPLDDINPRNAWKCGDQHLNFIAEDGNIDLQVISKSIKNLEGADE